MNLTGGMSGRFRIIKTKADGTVTFDQSCHNVVLESGLIDLLDHQVNIKYNDYYWEDMVFPRMRWLFLGTGTTEPKVSDTGLENRSSTLPGKAAEGGVGKRGGYSEEGYSNWGEMIVTGHADSDNHFYYSEITFEFRYGAGEAEGVWTELGLAESTSYAAPFTRALIRDDNGNPISLTVLSDEYLSVFYTVRYEDGLGEPSVATITMGGSSYDVTLSQNPGGWIASNTMYNFWRAYWPFKRLFPHRDSDGRRYGYSTEGADESFSTNRSFDPATMTITHQTILNPSNIDKYIRGLINSIHDMESTPMPAIGGSYNQPFAYMIHFTPPLVKLADHSVTIDVGVTLAILGAPVEGVGHTATTTSLDFSWDAYPNATEYQLVLRQAGTVISSQTVTAPTATASFTGLTAATEYHLDIKPKTAGRDGARSIYSATTGAA